MEQRPGVGTTPGEGRVARGWRLTQVAWRLIRRDRTMSVLALAGIGSATLFTFLILGLGGYFARSHHSGGHLSLIAALALYPSVLVSVFFNVALASAASAAFDGCEMSAGEAIRIAWVKRRRIALWSLISVVVGTLITQIASRLPGGARLAGWLFGAAWGLATIFVVPILAMEGSGAVDAVKRSAGLVRSRWGEGISGVVAIGTWAVVATVPLAILMGVGAAVIGSHPGTGVALLGTGLIGLVAVSALVAATRQVFAVALYRFAIDAPIGGFAGSDLEYPFVADPSRKKRKSWILRIGVPILAALVVLIVIGIVIGPRRHHTAAEGYFHAVYPAASASGVFAGTPVLYEGHRIGVVLRTEPGDASVRVVLRVDPRFSGLVASSPAFIAEMGGRKYLRIGPPPHLRGSPGPL